MTRSILRSLYVVFAAACGGATPTPTMPPNNTPKQPEEAPRTVEAEDPYLWLEEVESERALAWARAQNTISEGELGADPEFEPLKGRLRAILDAKDKIPFVGQRGGYLYNFWTDGEHPRGLWRRTTLAEYRKASPRWELLLDLDALGRAEGESWVWAGAVCLYPRYERCLVSLSRGGADANVVREFDLKTRSFVVDGFSLPEAKSSVGWRDQDSIYVGTDFGPGSLTNSGYPRVVKLWRRGEPLASAVTIFEGAAGDISVSADREHDHGRARDVVYRGTGFYSSELYLIEAAGLRKVEKPEDASLSFWDDQVLLTLRSPWSIEGVTWPAGSLLVADAAAYLAGQRSFTALFSPTPQSSLADVVTLERTILVQELVDVRDTLYAWRRVKGAWTRSLVPTEPLAATSVWAWDEHKGDDFWISSTGFLTPSTLALELGGRRSALKRSPARFKAEGLAVTQHFARSRDGTSVPYFQVGPQVLPEGGAAALIEGYGGFEVSLTPSYQPLVGAAWLERGGVYVVPNLRGGGEYGPTWHQAAVGAGRQRAYDDFAAIAEDLIARGVTRPERLGIVGGSNGGLLVGVMMTQRPELFGAVVCQAPLLDMRRFHRLLAGASWIDEYGDPDDPTAWGWISAYSPYQRVRAEARYPRVLFTTSTRDDRVHPGHARKMMARMLELGHDALFYENIEGGHGGAADNAQIAHLEALAFTFLARQLGLPPRASP